MKVNTLAVLSGLLLAASVTAQDVATAESFSELFTKGRIDGLLRYSAQHRDSNLHLLQDSATPDISDEKTQQYSSLGGYLGFETAPWMNTSAGATFYTSNPVGNNPDDRRGLGGLYEEDGGQDSYNVLGEAFLKIQSGDHLFKTGRQEMNDYRFVAPSNIRMTPITHQGTIYENRSIEGLRLNFAFVNKMKERNAEKFIGMVRGARVQTGCGEVDALGECIVSGSKKLIRGDFDPGDYDDSGSYRGDSKDMPMFGAVYSSNKTILEVWDYYVEDFLNMIYLYGQHSFSAPGAKYAITLAAQYGNQQDVGDHVGGNVDTWFYGFNFQINAPGLTYFANFNEVAYNEDSYDGGTIFVRWGTPQMFNRNSREPSHTAPACNTTSDARDCSRGLSCACATAITICPTACPGPMPARIAQRQPLIFATRSPGTRASVSSRNVHPELGLRYLHGNGRVEPAVSPGLQQIRDGL